MQYRKIKDISCTGDTFVIHDVKLCSSKRRCNLVLYDFNFGSVTDNIFTRLDLAYSTDVQANTGVELECITTGRRFRITEHNTNLHTDLVDENDSSLALVDDTCQFSKCLTHQ